MHPSTKFALTSAGLLAVGYLSFSYFSSPPQKESGPAPESSARKASEETMAADPSAAPLPANAPNAAPLASPSPAAEASPSSSSPAHSPSAATNQRKSNRKAAEPKAESLGLSYVDQVSEESRHIKKAASELPQASWQASADLKPANDRWIGALSGQGAKVSMGRSRADAPKSCQIIENGQCVRVPAPKDMSLAGVVMKTQRLADVPSTPLAGKVSRGNFADFTPALYVK